MCQPLLPNVGLTINLVVNVIDAAGHITTSIYDDANRVKEVDYPVGSGSGTVKRCTYYDGLGRKTQETDEAGVSTGYTYDFRGLLTSVTLAVGTPQSVTTVYAYDELGNLITQTDANGHTTTNRYDALGRRIARLLPGGQGEGYCYDRFTGNLIYQTNFNGVIITNLYDYASGRLTNCSSVGYKTTYSYSQTGLRTNMVDASGVTAYFYNGLSQLTNKTVTWTGQAPVKVNYGYDSLGSLAALWSSTANGVSNVYQVDLLGRMTNVLANGSAAASYGFDVLGNLQSLHYGNGVTNLCQYDSRNRLTNLVWQSGGTVLASFGYTVSATGNRTASTETLNNPSSPITRTYAWAYDYLYRLTGETLGGSGYPSPQAITYGFDAVGNRTNRTSGVAGITNQSPTFTANDWLAGDGYDSNGSTTNSTGIAYQYDVLNHLTNANNGAVVIAYDGDGNRICKKVGGTTTYYLVDDRNPSGYAQVLEEWTATGSATNLSRVYNYGLGLISQRIQGLSTNYFGTDGHGSARFLLDSSGTMTDTYAYDAYGTLIYLAGTTQNRYLYCGQQWDSDLGLYYNRARYLNPNTGRFWSRDSFEGRGQDPMSLHNFTYCENNAPNKIDPSGKDGVDIILSVLDVIGTFSTHLSASTSLSAATGKGGPDVTKALNRTLLDVEAAFYRWSRYERMQVAERMRDLGSAVFTGGRGGAAGAWDIIPLMSVGFGEPYLTADKDYLAGSGLWTRTVAFSGKCFYAGAVNYAIWGKMNKLCFDYYNSQGLLYDLDPREYNLPNAIHTVQAWKHFKYNDFGTTEMEAEAFTTYGFNGNLACPGLPCQSSGEVVQAKMFNWCWEPMKPRN